MFKKQTIWLLAMLVVVAGISFAQEASTDQSTTESVAAQSTVAETTSTESAAAEAVAEEAAPVEAVPAEAAVAEPAAVEPAEVKPAPATTIPLWPDAVPGKLKSDEKDWPTLTLYLLPESQGPRPAVLICPGGGYGGLAMDHEGHQIAQWLNTFGVSGIILQYRHAPLYGHPIPMQDAMRAMRTVRARAGEWNIDPNCIGVMGFSAGGHLASTVGTHFDMGAPTSSDPIEQVKSRPDFMILMYPVITFHADYTHMGSRNNLIGENPEPNLIEYYSNETQITPSTPPTFIVHSYDDKAVPVENSIKFFQGLRWQNISTEMHIFPYGGHGFGLAPNDPNLHTWAKHCEEWMRHQGYVK